MSRLVFSLSVVLLVVASFASQASTPSEPFKSSVNQSVIEENLLSALESDNAGLIQSAAFYLGEYKSERAVIPLMKLLHSECCEGVRITAALSLAKIGTQKGLYAVKQSGIFDHSEAVRKFCLQFYNAKKEK